jgi:hypothetical protein
MLVLLTEIAHAASPALLSSARRRNAGPVLLVSTKSYPGSSNATSPIDTTGANFILLSVSYAVSGATVNDSKSNTWTSLTNNGSSLRLFYCFNPTVGTNHTFTGNASYVLISAVAFSGVKTSPFDVESIASTASGPTLSAGSITPSQNKSLIIAAVTVNGDGTSTSINNGFTIVQSEQYVSGVNVGSGIAYKVITTGGAINPTWTNGTNTAFMAANIAAFKY